MLAKGIHSFILGVNHPKKFCQSTIENISANNVYEKVQPVHGFFRPFDPKNRQMCFDCNGMLPYGQL